MKRNFLLVILTLFVAGNFAFGQAPPAANLQATLATPNSVNVSWVSQAASSVSGLVLNYREKVVAADVTSSVNPWSTVSLSSSTTQWTHTGVVVGKTYEYSLQLQVLPLPVGPLPAFTSSSGSLVPTPAAISGANYASITVPTPITPPAAPTNLFIDLARATSTSLYMTWTDNAINEEGFEIRFSTDGRNFGNILVPGANRTNYTLTGLFANIPYVIEVKAYNSSGTLFSDPSRTGGTTLKMPPSAPMALTAIETCVNDAKLYWTQPNMSNTEEIWVERSSDNVNFFVERTLSPNHMPSVGFYSATNLPENSAVFYRIRALNNLSNPNPANRTSAVSAVYRVQTKQAVGPFPPFNLKVVSKTDKSITYEWENRYDNIDNVCKTNVRTANHLKVWIDDVYVNDANSNFNGQRLILSADDKTFTLIGLQPKSKVQFGVYAVNGAFNRDSETITVTTTTLGPPSAPTNLATQPSNDALNNPNIFMSWKDNSDDEVNFVVEAATDPNKLVPVVRYAQNVNFFTHVPVDEGVTWYYRVYAENEFGKSGYTPVISGTVDYSKAPEAPYDAKASLVNGKPNITWKDFSQREASFDIERALGTSTTFARVATVGRNMLSFRDSTAAADSSYTYRVKAVNPKGSSAYTNTVTIAVPPATTGFTLENLVDVFPNPTVSNLRVNLPAEVATEGGLVSIYDQSQRLLFRAEFDATKTEHNFNMANAKAGMYLVVVTTETQKISKRVYKQQ